MKEEEKAALAAATLKDFFEQFGGPSEKYSFDLLSILLEELYDAKIVSILSEQIETGDQGSNDLQGGSGSEFTPEQPGGTGTPDTMEDGSGEDSQRQQDAL